MESALTSPIAYLILRSCVSECSERHIKKNDVPILVPISTGWKIASCVLSSRPSYIDQPLQPVGFSTESQNSNETLPARVSAGTDCRSPSLFVLWVTSSTQISDPFPAPWLLWGPFQCLQSGICA